MDIILVNAQENLYRLALAGKRIVEYRRDSKNKYLIHLAVYNPEENTVTEITPQRHKIDFISIENGIWKCREVYYASFEVIDESQIRIDIYRYHPDLKEETKVLSFIRDMDVISGNTRIKVFLLSESVLLVQTEVRKSNASENMMGNIAFSLSLYNLETGEETVVSDSNFINNGIHTIIPVSDTKIMVKTGYSYLEDPRLGNAANHESLIESVYIATIAKFIADITLSSDSVDMPLIESAYLDRYITTPEVTDNYTHFTVVDAAKKITKCIFFHNETDERLEYSLSSFDPEDMYITYVVNNIPYVRKNAENKVSFFNLLKAVSDIEFYEEQFLDQTGKIFITAPENDYQRIHIYSYPKFQQVINEKTKYLCSITSENRHYVYINA